MNDTRESLEFGVVLQNISQFSRTIRGQHLIENLKPLKESILAKHLQLMQEIDTLNRLNQSIPIAPSSDLRAICELCLKDGTIPIEQWTDLKSDILLSQEIRTFLKREAVKAYPHVCHYNTIIKNVDSLLPAITKVFDPQFNINDSASAELTTIRQKLRQKQQEINSRVLHVVKEYSPYLREPRYYLKNGIFSLPVIRAERRHVPGMVVDVSDTEQTLFIHPLVLITLQNEIDELINLEKHEVSRILLALSQTAKEYALDLLTNNELIGYFDFLMALSKYATQTRSVFLPIAPNPIIHLQMARHPLLDPALVVANTFRLDMTRGRILIISGPNAGGKTIALKTVGLLTYMFTCGLPLSVDPESELSYFDGIYTDIGDHQSIEANLSTFSGHIDNLGQILKNLQRRSLVILDELGSGTESRTGEAIALATLDYLNEHQAFALISSHFEGLKAIALIKDGVNLGSFSYDLEQNLPEYHFLEGVPGQSYGLEVAARYGLPQVILDRARAYLKKDKESHDFRKINAKILQIRADLQEKERQLDAELKKLSDNNLALEKLNAQQKNDHARFEKDYQKALQERLQAAESELNELIKKAYEQHQPHQVIAIKKEFDQHRTATERDATSTMDLAPNDYVQIMHLDLKGTIKSMNKNKATIISDDGMRVVASLSDLAPMQRPLIAKKAITPTKKLTPSVGSSLNIIGLHTDEAEMELRQFLDQAYGSGLTRVKIIHGFGTGALRSLLSKVLGELPYVSNHERALDNDGGGGATIVSFK